MTRSKILVVEDEPNLLTFYREALEQAGYRTAGVREGEKALSLFATFRPDLLILDLWLDGDVDGLEVLAALRYHSDTRVMILSAQNAEASIVKGLNLGADNYLVKPVSREQLVARVRAQLRRQPNGVLAEVGTVYHYGDLAIDLGQSHATRGAQCITFGNVERRILTRLLQTPDTPVTRKELMEVGWGQPEMAVKSSDARILLNCIYRVRDKLKQLRDDADPIRTIPNIGFSIAPPDESKTTVED